MWPEYIDLAVSKHLRLRHFLTHDDQASVWPKYVALDPRLLDKLELIFSTLERQRSADAPPLDLDVHSGFRTPCAQPRSCTRRATVVISTAMPRTSSWMRTATATSIAG